MTVKELREQLEIVEKFGYGDYSVVFIDNFDITHDFETGTHDTIEDAKIMVLG